jgi:hypothetical protein
MRCFSNTPLLRNVHNTCNIRVIVNRTFVWCRSYGFSSETSRLDLWNGDRNKDWLQNMQAEREIQKSHNVVSHVSLYNKIVIMLHEIVVTPVA